MKRLSCILIALAVMLLVSVGLFRSSGAYDCPTECTFGGYVYESDSLTPVQGALVKAIGQEHGVIDSAFTDVTGCYCMTNNLTEDWYDVQAFKLGKKSQIIHIWHNGQDLHVLEDLILEP